MKSIILIIGFFVFIEPLIVYAQVYQNLKERRGSYSGIVELIDQSRDMIYILPDEPRIGRKVIFYDEQTEFMYDVNKVSSKDIFAEDKIEISYFAAGSVYVASKIKVLIEK